MVLGACSYQPLRGVVFHVLSEVQDRIIPFYVPRRGWLLLKALGSGYRFRFSCFEVCRRKGTQPDTIQPHLPFICLRPTPQHRCLQTGSGKSYTMMGSGTALDDSVDPEDHGLIPRICSGIFERVDQVTIGRFDSRGCSFRVWEDVLYTPAVRLNLAALEENNPCSLKGKSLSISGWYMVCRDVVGGHAMLFQLLLERYSDQQGGGRHRGWPYSLSQIVELVEI